MWYFFPTYFHFVTKLFLLTQFYFEILLVQNNWNFPQFWRWNRFLIWLAKQCRGHCWTNILDINFFTVRVIFGFKLPLIKACLEEVTALYSEKIKARYIIKDE